MSKQFVISDSVVRNFQLPENVCYCHLCIHLYCCPFLKRDYWGTADHAKRKQFSFVHHEKLKQTWQASRSGFQAASREKRYLYTLSSAARMQTSRLHCDVMIAQCDHGTPCLKLRTGSLDTFSPCTCVCSRAIARQTSQYELTRPGWQATYVFIVCFFLWKKSKTNARDRRET